MRPRAVDVKPARRVDAVDLNPRLYDLRGVSITLHSNNTILTLQRLRTVAHCSWSAAFSAFPLSSVWSPAPCFNEMMPPRLVIARQAICMLLAFGVAGATATTATAETANNRHLQSRSVCFDSSSTLCLSWQVASGNVTFSVTFTPPDPSKPLQW